ncbi:MAG: T9SS type A sorting domain-containing protein [Saprospiraceae bacterium]|nr:T9SS type A sorting domain-containing protein [Saprospiraceae bacterium]
MNLVSLAMTKRTSLILLSISLLTVALAFQLQWHTDASTDLPVPTDGVTRVRHEGETGHEQAKREAWFALMHQTAPGVDWRSLEYQNQQMLAQHRKQARLLRGSGDQEILADGHLIGKWNERGSKNQAGSVQATAFDPETEEIWVISAGGTLFKGALDGSKWEVVNQDYKMSGDILQFIKTDTGRRLMAIINKVFHYSDDDGKTWTASKGLNTYDSNWGGRRNPIVLNDSLQTIYYLVEEWLPGPWKDDVGIYRSTDHGVNFEKVISFNDPDLDKYCLTRIKGANTVAMLKKADTKITELYHLDPATGIPQLVGKTTKLGLGPERANLEALHVDTVTTYYMYSFNNDLFVSTDHGMNWTYISSFEKNPWGVGLFVSEANPYFMMMGEVECHRSIDGGQSWQVFSKWWEYYDDVNGKMHADMMYFAEYKKKDGTPFFLISNHGGLNVTYDGATFDNLGLDGLNVGQFYDVVTDPVDELYIYAGSQDQGFQRGLDLWEGDVLDFDQAISGDYGHMVFTGFGQHLWMVYPGGWVSYWDYPVSGGVTAGYTLESDNESVWIPPLVADPDPSRNVVYMAGGALDGGKGSYILRLEVVNFEIQTEQLPFDFKAYSNGEVSVLAFSPFDPNVMYAATTNGYFFTSHDKGQTWEQSLSTVPGGQYLYGAAILPSKTDTGTIYFGGSGYSGPAMLISEDGGMSFTSMNEGLPPTLVLDLASNDDESLLFAATETGPYVFVKSEQKWHAMMGAAAPVQTYWSVEFLPLQQTVRFGTYGRGVWDFVIEDVVPIAEQSPQSHLTPLRISPNPVYGNEIKVAMAHLSMATVQWQIMDLSGRIISRGNQAAGNGQDLIVSLPSFLSAGCYVLKTEQRGQIRAGKWIKME